MGLPFDPDDDVVSLSTTVTAETYAGGLLTLARATGHGGPAIITLTRDAEHRLLKLLMTRAGIPVS